MDEVYPLGSIKPKIPIYNEHWLEAGDQVRRLVQALGIPWDLSDYQPLPDWKPCHAPEQSARGYDLWAINYRLAFHNFSHSMENPWLNEVGQHHPSAYSALAIIF